ncbi:MAG: NFACT RNA binding domain-containing protein [Sphaerochaetaceae bacterium]|nr:NFACT RNA binding domain-containing protein [Sphaerochaetaceae bacterium]
MSLNYKEIELIIDEAHLEGAKIQAVVQSSFHSVTWELYDRERGRFAFYTEIGTLQSRLHLLSPNTKIAKTKKLQRFEQYARKNLEGSVIVACHQLPFDRAVVWDLVNHDRKLKVYFRFYSGPGANIIVTDENNVIQDLLLRRPGRDEMSSETLVVEERSQSDRVFTVRDWDGDSFNAFIEKTCAQEQADDTYQQLYKQVQARMEHELGRISSSLRSAEKSIEANKGFEELRLVADLLSANSYQIKRGQDRVTLTDWANGGASVTVTLDKSLTPGANVQAYYDRYQKAKGTYENAIEERDRLQADYDSTRSRFLKALEDCGDELANIRHLKAILDKTAPAPQVQEGPGVRAVSGGFQILAGRNAKENDDLLRHYAKGNDMWLHTRDFPGGYVFIKFRRDKTIPLEVLLDAANIAVLYSKGRNASSVDLYYTQVKYLRRAKDGKTGLVLPTQEKNLTIKPDPTRIARLLPKEEQ